MPGCETACIKTNGGVEICDGLDNDCDGVVDDNLGAPTITCKTQGRLRGHARRPARARTAGSATTRRRTRRSRTRKFGCDTLDNDCDGQTDEPFDIGKSCIFGSGPCAGTGTWVCDNSMAGDHRCMGSMKPPGVEICNGIDNDCDGWSTSSTRRRTGRPTTSSSTSRTAQDVTMFAYEASRYDANGTEQRLRLDPPPLLASRASMPWTNVTKDEAEAACAQIGTELAPLHGDRVAGRLQRLRRHDLPLRRHATSATDCNGYDYTAGADARRPPIATGAARVRLRPSRPAAGDELFDMSGNVKEWVDRPDHQRRQQPGCTTPPAYSSCAAAPTTSPASSTTRSRRR